MRVPICLPALVVVSCLAAHAQEEVTVFAAQGERQTYQGFGASSEIFYTDGASYNNLPENKRQEIAQKFWGETGFNLLRLWVHTHWSAAYVNQTYGKLIADAKAANPNLIVFHGPMTGQASNWASLAQQIKDLKDNYGIKIAATGITNEPNAGGNAPPSWFPPAIKQLRTELNNRGLNDVIIIAPEVSNVDDGGMKYLDAIVGDDAATAALGAFSTHSYNMCVTKKLSDWIFPYLRDDGKTYWMTESSGDGWEDPNDYYFAANCAARFLSDINLLVTHWIYFISYHPCDPGPDGNRRHEIMCYNPDGSNEDLLKYYYYKQLAKTFAPGCVMRLCRIPEYEDYWDDGRYEWMFNTYDQQPPLCGAVGQNADGSWGLGVVNKSEDRPAEWGGYIPHEKTTFVVTFEVEELAGADDINFQVFRSSGTVRIDDEGTVTMKDGKVSVTVEMSELVTLRSGTGVKARFAPSSPGAVSAGKLRLESAAARGGKAVVRFAAPKNAGVIDLAVYSVDGARVKTLVSGHVPAGEHTLEWDTSEAAGMYVMRLKGGNVLDSKRLIVAR